ncbi:MAG: sulfate ABC transporter substrate-binding protein [Chloroflexi bacterium]|nr:sulfate ABC transporter substrate-binding protein [Chloroflexota bacterium]
MHRLHRLFVGILALVVLSVSVVHAQEPLTLTLAGYAVPREAYGEIIPLFVDHWKAQTGQDVTFETSWVASGAQSRAVIGGFEADIVALSQEAHVTNIAKAGLITHDWQDNPTRGFDKSSLVILVVREGNPDTILDWADLAREGVEVVTPDPATSGGAQWNVMGAYGAAFRGQVQGFDTGVDGARAFLTAVFTNVIALDADGRESFLTFERGIGDVAITYENEYFAGIEVSGEGAYDIVYPSSTLVIENPIALVDTYVDAHGTREVAEAFLEFVYTPEAQAIFYKHGFRAPLLIADEEAAAVATPDPAVPTPEPDPKYPLPADLFTIRDFGGWPEVVPAIFGEEGVFTQVIAEVKGQ